MSLDSKAIIFGTSGMSWGMTLSSGDKIGINKWNDLRNELEFMRFGQGMQGQIEAAPVFQIVLGDGEPPLSGPAAATLNAMASKVETIVLCLEAETARIRRKQLSVTP